MKERRQVGDDLTGRRQGYSALKTELHYFFRRIWIVVIIIGLTSAAGLVGYGLVIREIQSQRHQMCLNVNTRHDNTTAALQVAAAEDIAKAPTQAIKIEIARRRDVTLGLIDAIVPKQNCDKLAPRWGLWP